MRCISIEPTARPTFSEFLYTLGGGWGLKLVLGGYLFAMILYNCSVLVSMEVENKTSEGNEPDNIENQVITYSAPWNIFSLGFSNKAQYPFRLAIGSFLPDVNN